MAKADAASFSDEEIEKLNGAKLDFGGKELQWVKLTGECELFR